MRTITLAATLLNLSLSVGADTSPLLQNEPREAHEGACANLAFESIRQEIADAKKKSDEDIKAIEDLVSSALSANNMHIKQGVLQKAQLFLPGVKNSTTLLERTVNEWEKTATSLEEKSEVSAAKEMVSQHLVRIGTLETKLQIHLNQAT